MPKTEMDLVHSNDSQRCPLESDLLRSCPPVVERHLVVSVAVINSYSEQSTKRRTVPSGWL